MNLSQCLQCVLVQLSVLSMMVEGRYYPRQSYYQRSRYYIPSRRTYYNKRKDVYSNMVDGAPSSKSKCRDIHQHCPRLQKVGWCQNKPAAMAKICAKTCNLCKKKCRDARKDCVMLAKYDWCTHKRATMYEYCPATCRFCKEEVEEVTTIAQTTVPPTTKPAITRAPLCVDKLRHCKHLQRAGWCEHKKDKMKQGCRLTCKFCVPPLAHGLECEDVRADCIKLQLFGWCSSRRQAMEGICRATCKFCGPTQPPTTKPKPTMAALFTKPKAGGCRDTRSDCRKLSKIGMCRLRKEGMKKICPVSCGFCGIPPTGKPTQKETCSDMYGKTRCEYYKYLGWCEKHATNMRQYCKDTCVCKNKSVIQQVTGPVGCKDSQHGCCWDNKTIRESRDGNTCPKCEDDPRFRVLCDRFGEDCDGDGGLGESLRKYCPKRCNLC